MRKAILYWLTFTLANVILAFISLQLKDAWSLSSLVWFPAGMLQGVLCVLAPRRWPVWVATVSLVHLMVSQWYGRPLAVSLIFASFDAITVMVTAWTWQFFFGVKYSPRSISDILSLTGMCLLSGVIERFVTNGILYLCYYPIDFTLSLPLVGCYVLSYIALTFFVMYLIVGEYRVSGSHRLYSLWLGSGLLIILLFFSKNIASDDTEWVTLAVWLALCSPMLLALTGDLTRLSGYLSLCAVVAVSATMFDRGPFAEPLLVNRLHNVQMTTWYIVVLTFPSLLICSYLSRLINTLARRKIRLNLINAVLAPGQVSHFRLDCDERLHWYHGAEWAPNGRSPLSWALFMAWIHPQDRFKLEQLKEKVWIMPQILTLRVSDGQGGYNPANIALGVCMSENLTFIEGMLSEISINKEKRVKAWPEE